MRKRDDLFLASCFLQCIKPDLSLLFLGRSLLPFVSFIVRYPGGAHTIQMHWYKVYPTDLRAMSWTNKDLQWSKSNLSMHVLSERLYKVPVAGEKRTTSPTTIARSNHQVRHWADGATSVEFEQCSRSYRRYRMSAVPFASFDHLSSTILRATSVSKRHTGCPEPAQSPVRDQPANSKS